MGGASRGQHKACIGEKASGTSDPGAVKAARRRGGATAHRRDATGHDVKPVTSGCFQLFQWMLGHVCFRFWPLICSPMSPSAESNRTY